MKLWSLFRPFSSGRKTSVSSAHPVSNLRLIRHPVPDRESKAEKQLQENNYLQNDKIMSNKLTI